MRSLVLASELSEAGGGLATAAAVAVTIAGPRDPDDDPAAALLVEHGAARSRGPTLLASAGALEVERTLSRLGLEVAARGRLAWLRLERGEGWLDRLRLACEEQDAVVVVHLRGADLRTLLESAQLRPRAVLLRADLPAQRALTALAARELIGDDIRVRVASRAPGRVATRRALSGIDPGGEASRRARRLARGLLGERGQALPLVLGAIAVLVLCSLLLAALGGAITGTSRTQRAADLAALSAARSMRDDFERLFTPSRLAGGSPNPAHLTKAAYLERASAAAAEAASRNGVGRGRLEVAFPDAGSFAPLRVRATVSADLDAGGRAGSVPVVARSTAEAVPPASGSGGDRPAIATGGGYSGPLAYRQGKPMRPDVAVAFDRLARAASSAGLSLIVNSGFRSDAEQAALFAAHPDPKWVAPPGTSLHRCATELDLGPPAAYGWLAANASRFGFVRRYAWEPWHFGFDAGPDPCSADGDRVAASTGSADGGSAGAGLPAFVPVRYRDAIAAAAGRWNVPAALLAAQLMAESNFNPFAVSPAGAQGIAQFMPATASAYGLSDPFDAPVAIDAQAHLMANLLEQFGQVSLALAAYNAGPGPIAACGCVPAIAETQAYVARILGLMGGAGAIAPPPTLEVRLVD